MNFTLFDLKIVEYSFFITAILVIMIGLYGALVKKSLIKVVIGLSIFDSGINLLLISIGYITSGTAPIFSPALVKDMPLTLENIKKLSEGMVDPVPQALVLTAIVIGFGVTAVALSLVIRLYRHHQTLNIDEIKNLKW
ncbi:MAG: NADH-quinone oxidoreductase subunit K [Bacteroidales bacterium]|nr:NADH-quinone oxidoreductase subunit K [Bacteroidales bacterium]